MLYGASLMPNLLVLDASDQALSGHLSAVQIPTLEVLDLSNNSIQVKDQPFLLTLQRQSSKAVGPSYASMSSLWVGACDSYRYQSWYLALCIRSL